MKKFMLFLGVLLFGVTSVNTAQVGQIWVPGTHKALVQSGTAEMMPLSQHLSNLEPMIDPRELECMAKNIYFEAAIESTAGKIAVAQVTMNRVRSRHYPDSICKVVYQGKHHSNGFPVRDRCQFSWYCDGKGDEPRPTPAWKDSVEIAEYIIRTPSLLDITDGATHYHADWMEKFPKWAHQKKKLVKIDTHIFYKKRNNFNF